MTVPNKEIRNIILDIVHESGAAHIGTAFSIVEILNAVFLNIDINKIKAKNNKRDRVILSKGHGAAALYAVMSHYGLLSNEEVDSYFKNGSFLEGHVSHFVPFVEHSTGALGHGLSVALGIALGLRSKKIDSRVFAILGDGELNEGSNWEAFMYAGQQKVGNLCVLIDKNCLDMMGEISKSCTIDPLKLKLESFNWGVFEVDGHNENKINQKIKETKNFSNPVAIICNTIKGRGVSFMENNVIWHYRCPQGEDYKKALKELSE